MGIANLLVECSRMQLRPVVFETNTLSNFQQLSNLDEELQKQPSTVLTRFSKVCLLLAATDGVKTCYVS